MGTIIDILLSWLFNITYGKVNQVLKGTLSANQEESQTKKLRYITSKLKED